MIERCDRILTVHGVRGLQPGEREELLEWNRNLAAQGLRVLALATKEGDQADADLTSLIWVGLAGLSDPPAPGVRETIRGVPRGWDPHRDDYW